MGHHGRIVARRLGIPLISTFHTLYTEYSHYFPLVPQNTARWWLADQMRRYYAGCDTVIVPSREAGRRLEAIGVPAEKLHVVPTGVAEAPVVLPQAVEQTRRTYSLPPQAPVILFVGRLAREKNLDLLVDAFARIVADKPAEDLTRPVLLLVGSGPYSAACRERVKRAGLEASVRFTGFLKRSELAPVYAAATIFAFPSPTETQGVVLSEAQGHGLPCVVVEGGGAPEFVRPEIDALVVPATRDAFSAAITELLENDARRRAFAAAALQSPLRPTPAEMARRIVAIYDEHLANPALATAVR
jgi:glycosyltransferase involved in cell wall biosynthesis